MTFTFAQVTDPHLDGTDGPRQRFRRVAQSLAELVTPVDAIVVTGDIVQAPGIDNDEVKLAEYRLVHETLSTIAPVGYCRGNSDDHTFERFLNEAGLPAEGMCMRLDIDGASFLLADSHVDDALHGHLTGETLAWLERELGQGSDPVVLALHHPPVPLGHPVIDDLRLDNADALEALVKASSRIVGTVCGHTHAATASQFAGRPLFIAPGVQSAGRVPWMHRDMETTPPTDPSFPPGFALHRVDGQQMTSYPAQVSAAS